MTATREIRVGDCRELLRAMPPESVNCVVTSPPYWGLRDYGVKGQLGLEATPGEYVATMVDVFREVRRVLRPDGTLWLNLGDCYATGAGKVGDCPGGGEQGARWRGDIDRPRDDKRGYRGERLANGRGDQPAILRKKTRALRDGSHCGKHTAIAAMGPMTQPNRMPIPGLKPKDLVGIPWRVAFALQADGWWLRSDIVWAKPNPMPESVQDRPTKAHEYVFLLSKSEHYHYDAAAIREQQVAPEASTPDDAARAFSRRRQTIIDPKQRKLTPEDMKRRRSGNKERTRRDGNGGVYGHGSHQAFGVPWTDKDGLRNKRSVWTVATEPYGGAHFATFPQKLIEPAILAGCPGGGGSTRPVRWQRDRRRSGGAARAAVDPAGDQPGLRGPGTRANRAARPVRRDSAAGRNRGRVRAVFRPCPEGCNRGWIPIVIKNAGAHRTPFGLVMCGGGGSIRCTCCVPGYIVVIVRERA